MGQDVSAILAYGFGSEEEGGIIDEIKFSQEDSNDWEEEYAIRKGWEPVPYPEEGGQDYDKEYGVWSKNRDELSSILKKLRVEIGYHGYDFGCHYVGITVKRVYWGEIEEIKLSDLKEASAEWNNEISDFCKVMGIEYKVPKWMLMAEGSN